MSSLGAVAIAAYFFKGQSLQLFGDSGSYRSEFVVEAREPLLALEGVVSNIIPGRAEHPVGAPCPHKGGQRHHSGDNKVVGFCVR